MEILLYLFAKSYLMIQVGQSEGNACGQSFYNATNYENWQRRLGYREKYIQTSLIKIKAIWPLHKLLFEVPQGRTGQLNKALQFFVYFFLFFSSLFPVGHCKC